MYIFYNLFYDSEKIQLLWKLNIWTEINKRCSTIQCHILWKLYFYVIFENYVERIEYTGSKSIIGNIVLVPQVQYLIHVDVGTYNWYKKNIYYIYRFIVIVGYCWIR